MERLGPETLRDWLENPEVYLLDGRSPRAWEASGVKIPRVRRLIPQQPVEIWAQNIPKDKKVVLY